MQQPALPAYQHVVVVISMVLGLAVTQLLKGIAQLYRTRKRVQSYWIHWGWVILLLILALLVWWTYFSYRGVADWDFFRFVLYIFPMIAFYYLTAIAIPDPAEPVTSLKDYYFANRVGFFGTFAAYGVLAAVAASVVRGLPLSDPSNVFRVLLVILMLIVMRSSSERVHAAVLTACGALLVAFVSLYHFRLG
jgi:hypothetical protein